MRRWISFAVALSLAACDDGAVDPDGGARVDGGTPGGDAGVPDAGDAPPADGGSTERDGGPGTDGGTVSDGGGASVDPSATGPASTTTVDGTVTRGSRSTPVVAHVPAGGPSPLAIFVPGFQLESSRYAATAEHLASHGFVVVRADPPDPLFGVSHVEMAADVIAVIDWATDASGPLAGEVSGPLLVFGHSLGGKVSAMVAHRDTRVDALLALDPVNGGNPFSGYSADLPDIVPDEIEGLTIPVGFMGETTNQSGSMACAPADQNFETFYAAATSASWAAMWDFTGADHMDFVDDTTGCGFTCSACPDGTADEATVQAAVHTLVAAFARRHLLGDASMDPWLTGAMTPGGVVVTSR